MSDDNDKTRIKSPLGKPSGANSSDDDKTRIARKNTHSPADLEAQQKARLAAQKKAQELEKRLALIEAKKKAAAQQNAAQQNDSSDKTRIQSRPQPAPVQQVEQDDRTRIAPAKPKPAAEPEGDKTVFKSRPAPAQSPAADDNGDKTVFKSRPAPAQPSAADDNGDKTVFKGAVNQPAKTGDLSQNEPAVSIEQGMPLEEKPTVKPDDPTTLSDYSNTDISGPPPNIPETPKIDVTQEQKPLKGRFIFEDVLGAGGMGVVYKAKDLLKVEAKDRDPYVAIKVLGDEFKAHPEAFIALQRESRKTQRIAHRNIVNVYDFDRDGDTVFITMEFLDGKPLDKLIRQYKATGLPEEDAWNILGGISAALIHAHEQKIIHSDFKPGNIFVTNAGIAKVFDFGIARAVAKAEKLEESVDDKTVFDAGNLGALTPAYASLEMLEGETPDIRDDIYALGCIAYEMFTGNHPFDRVHADEAMRKKMKVKRIPNITKRQFKVIERALAFKREDRVATVNEFWRDITRKKKTNYLAAGLAVAMLSAVGVLAYQNYFAPKEAGFNADEIRSEIEREVLINNNKEELAELLDNKEFTSSWEKKLWQAFDILSQILGAEDPWLKEQKALIAKAYVDQIEKTMTEDAFDRARELLESAKRYVENQEALTALATRIDEAQAAYVKRQEEEAKQRQIAAKEKQQKATQVKVQKEKNKAYDVALSTVNEQLLCRTTINMRDIAIAVDKLRSLNMSRYSKHERELVGKLAKCITKIGRTFPERGEEFKRRSLRIFPKNDTLAKIKIEPKDPCDLALAGLGSRGARAICRDPLKKEGTDLGKGPALVVIPGKGSMSAFAVGKYEITIEDLNRFCSNTEACSKISGSSKNPATNVDAKLMKKYLAWLSEMSKRKYRLPNKAEWVYAARANSSKMDSNRNCRLDSRGIKKGGVIIKATTGQQNTWGLVNYLGNARELVRDGRSYLALGGSYDTLIEECIVTKSESHSGDADALTGFRVLREIENKS